MRYRNIQTGKTVDTSSEIVGGLWELLETTEASPEQEPKQKEPKKKG